jgi:hypothetical protein
MAVYKVPQDVEADDKLLGPFSFRQFIYLIVVALAIGIAFLLSKIFIGLIIIPLPFILFFGALALPLKKDQPMEAYLGALVSFYFLKPRKRLWVPDGLTELVEITAPRQVEPERVKAISSNEAHARLGYLTDIVESRGWAVRGVGVPTHGVTSMSTTAYQEAQGANDMFDDNNHEAQKLDQLIEARSQQNRSHLIDSMKSQPAGTPTQSTPTANSQPIAASPISQSIQPQVNSQQTISAPAEMHFNPYPDNIKQSVIQPVAVENRQSQAITTQNTSGKPPSPDIIKLANESEGLTIAAVAQQAHRIESRTEKSLPDSEVEISLR